MPLHFDIFPLFPQTLSISHLNTVNSKHVLKILKKLPWQKTDFSEYYDVLGGNYVTTNYHILKNFPGLEDIFIEHIDLHIKRILKYRTSFKICSSWGTMTEPNGFSRLHYHTNSWLSAIYYPEGDPNFKVSFGDYKTDWFKDEPIEYNTFNEAAKNFTVTKNMLILFPSSLRHQILPNKSKKNRYSIAFNIMPNGEFNYPSDSQLNLTINT